MPRQARNAALKKFIARAASQPIQPAMTTRIHASSFVGLLVVCSAAGRWPDTIGKKTRNAASSSAAESGNANRQCHAYTPVAQRSVTPEDHISNEVHGAHKAKGFILRSLGIE